MKVSSEKDHILYYSGNVNAKIGNDTIISENKYEELGVIFSRSYKQPLKKSKSKTQRSSKSCSINIFRKKGK